MEEVINETACKNQGCYCVAVRRILFLFFSSFQITIKEEILRLTASGRYEKVSLGEFWNTLGFSAVQAKRNMGKYYIRI
jgi:hypothetical protein